jgi:phage baseplate assembly protein gpV
MKRLFTFVAVLAAFSAITAAVLLVASGGRANASAKRGGVTTIRFRAHEVLKPRFIDSAPPTGPSTGDEITEKEILYSHGQRIGYDLLHATAITVNRATRTIDVVAEGVLVLKEGTITFQGETTFRRIQVGVIGGTGAYQHVLGQLTILRTLPNGDDIDQVQFTHVD